MRNTKPGKTIAVLCISLLVSALLMSFYLSGPIRGNLAWSFLPAKMFGVPEKLIQHGIKPLFTAPGETGWDGQFYYYMANDLLASSETTQHLDNPSYRYQRIGVPALSNLVAKLMLQDWVSPEIYYFTQLFLILMAAVALARLFETKGYSPFLSLFWSCAYGVQITLLNGLPDAAAEAFLILSLVCYLNERWFFYTVTMSLAVLSREAFVIITGMLFVSEFINQLRSSHGLKNFKALLNLVIPILVFLAWQGYLYVHFQQLGGKVSGILAPPLVGFITYLKLNFLGFWQNDQVGKVLIGFTSLILFITLIGYSLYLMTRVAISTSLRNTRLRRFIVALLPLIFLYTCFGPIVMFDMTGYLKITGICFIVIPLCFICLEKKLPLSLIVAAVLITLYGIFCIYKNRLAGGPLISKPLVSIDKQTEVCQSNLAARMEILEIKEAYSHQLYRKLFHRPDYKILTVELTNLTEQPFYTIAGSGAINLSYQIIDRMTEQVVLGEGLGTRLIKTLQPNQKLIQKMLVAIPAKLDLANISIRLVLVQENCGRF